MIIFVSIMNSDKMFPILKDLINLIFQNWLLLQLEFLQNKSLL